MEKEMVKAARTNFEETLAKSAVPALTKAKWLERVAFPLGTSEESDLLYGSSLKARTEGDRLHVSVCRIRLIRRLAAKKPTADCAAKARRRNLG